MNNFNLLENKTLLEIAVSALQEKKVDNYSHSRSKVSKI